jgi:hypothetical protein
MVIPSFPFQTVDWQSIPIEIHKGDTGEAGWQIIQLENIRIRLVKYSADYKADHWCNKGHIIHCLHGSMITVLADGRTFELKEGMSYIVGDENEAHSSSTSEGCLLFIVD